MTFPNPVKLLIWDLDDTFWRGTLSEGAVEALAENLALVRDTAARGLVHTIVSKNDLAPVEAELTRLGIRELFVFLRVGWQPKGPVITELLDSMQLRAPNALFLDDNAANRQEAAFYNPGLQTADPADLPRLAPLLRASGRPDPTLSRLQQYQLLERQQAARQAYGTDNLAYLRSAGLTVEFREGPAALLPDLERIEELINRSNQLNFTKVRVEKEKLPAALADPTRRWGTVRVRDHLGDYGLVGVYALNRESNELEQFTFSCRILHLGIEQFTYAWLGFPRLEVAGEVVSELNRTDRPDWIAVAAGPAAAPTPAPAAPRLRVLLKGGCDLGQLTPFLQAFDVQVAEELNYANENQVIAHLEHTALLRAGRELPPAEQQRLAERLPFLGREAFATRLWSFDYDALIFSPLMDYTQELYRERATGYEVPFGGYYDLTARDPAAQAARFAQRRYRGLDEAWLRQFAQDFACEGQISPVRFQQNLRWLRAQVPARIPIFFLNGAEIEASNPHEPTALARHQAMNAALAAFVAEAANCFVVDVRPLIQTPADVTNNLRHYQPRHYRALAQQLAAALAAWHGQGQLRHSRWAAAKARVMSYLPAAWR